MSGLVAHRIRVDLGRAHAVEQANWEGTCDQAHGPGIMGMQDLACVAGVDQLAEARGDLGESLVPGDLGEGAGPLRASPPQGAGEAERGIAPGAVIGDGALTAELTARDGMIGVSKNLGDDPALYIYGETAGVVAIARTSGFDNVLLQHRRR